MQRLLLGFRLPAARHAGSTAHSQAVPAAGPARCRDPARGQEGKKCSKCSADLVMASEDQRSRVQHITMDAPACVSLSIITPVLSLEDLLPTLISMNCFPSTPRRMETVWDIGLLDFYRSAFLADGMAMTSRYFTSYSSQLCSSLACCCVQLGVWVTVPTRSALCSAIRCHRGTRFV